MFPGSTCSLFFSVSDVSLFSGLGGGEGRATILGGKVIIFSVLSVPLSTLNCFHQSCSGAENGKECQIEID